MTLLLAREEMTLTLKHYLAKEFNLGLVYSSEYNETKLKGQYLNFEFKQYYTKYFL